MKRLSVRRALPLFLWLSAGIGAGTLNGLLGAAGGVLLVTLFPLLLTVGLPFGWRETDVSRDRRDLLATTLCVMLPTSAVSFFLYLIRGTRPSLSLLSVLILPTILGGWLGAYLLDKIPRTALKNIFSLLVIVSGFRMLFW